MNEYVTTISVNSIEATLKFSAETAELFPFQMSAILERYPDNFTEYAAAFRPPALAYCGYYIHCKNTGANLLLSFDDFCLWSADAIKTEEGRRLLNHINELYTKAAEA
jgi:hypothetical protein